ncbi:heparan N-sulfatase [Arenibacter sp. TNZ]|uniref:sulfatase family protein n=1 Tax=Arenibacter TaxID=178469 RepID=UPI000CD3DD6E|nr:MULTISPECIES: sulfatase [Arenibacter]MCM4171253.1 heparan N-sulfatase [Arenibacter sp. TNZ]
MKQLFVLVTLYLSFNSTVHSQNEKLNIIVFIADDVSWDDLGCYGNTQVKTPNIDQLAKDGLKFDNFYLTASSCSPSRNSIITGRYPHNTGAAELHTTPPLDMMSFPELLRNNNYYSVLAGKFHMGPYAKRGFDKMYEGHKDNGDGGEESWVISLKERPKNKSFFMWFASYDAHREWGPNKFSGTHRPDEMEPPFYLSNGTGTKSDLAKYYDEIKRFDFYIGEVVTELKAQKELDNTLIIIMSDNGRPFPHSKTRVNDRGMKTPFVMHWPKGIKNKGLSSHSLVSAVDIAPTLLTIAGIDYPDQFQGISFDLLLIEPEHTFRNYIYAEHNWHDYEAHERMVRNKDYMYILNSRPMKPQNGPLDAVGSPSFRELEGLRDKGELSAIQADVFMVPRPHEELYDYKRDPLQLLNVASLPEYKETLSALRKTLTEWMVDTGDNIPENLTKDWYLKEAGLIKTEFHNIRGEMPGKKLNATRNNAKGKF